MTAPKLQMTISLGNLLSIATTLVLITGGWVAMSSKIEQVDERSRANQSIVQRHSELIAQSQANEARTNERLRSIEGSVTRIEAGIADLTRYLREGRP